MLPRLLVLLGLSSALFDINRSFPMPNTGPHVLRQRMPFESIPEISGSLVGPRPLGFTKLNRKAWRHDTCELRPVNNSDYT